MTELSDLTENLLIFRDLNLRTPFYQQTSTYGHFGREGFPWEKPKNLSIDIEWLDNAEDQSASAEPHCSKKLKLS